MSLSEFAISDAGFWEKTALVALILFVAYLVIMWVAATLWTYRDIQTRSDDRALQAVCVALVAVFSLPGLVLYVLLRPQESLSERFERQLEAEAFMHEIQDEATCPSCRRRVGEQFVRCPYCRAQLASPCEQCGRNLSETWVVCPYCSAERSVAARPAAVRQAEPITRSHGWRWGERVPQPLSPAPSFTRRT
ncbi:MAG TPA: zinc ribbon domain-containing protein [Dehalococcoidia bacterium]|nr:zinc ribbon domain-containing protein [Dehalococcoidia bacterium]